MSFWSGRERSKKVGVSGMSLRGRAIKAYEEEKKRHKEHERQRTKNFAEFKARREFEKIFGAKPDQVQPVTPYECFIKCDGLTFRAREHEYETTFEVRVQCPQCHDLFFVEVNSLSSLGEALSNPAIKCPKCMNSSEPSEPRGSSVEERIAQKLREILDLLQKGEQDGKIES